MGMPNINITFQTKAATAIQRSQKGVVALIVRDSKEHGGHSLSNETQIPAGLGVNNQDYIRRAFLGYRTPPRQVLVYVVQDTAENLTEALDWLACQSFDYLAGPPDLKTEEAEAVAAWVKRRRADDHAVCKAVLPNTAADSEAVVNLTTDAIQVGEKTYTAAEYCSRIAGLIAGTPMTISCTYAPLPEVKDVVRLSREEMDQAVNAGEFILFHDGEKVKVGRGVNSLVTVTAEKGAAFQKIKVVEALDMIQNDIRMTAQDGYIGKYPNSYDSKCVFITAIKGYLDGLETGGILQKGTSVLGIDLEGQEAYLQLMGTDTSGMSEQELKEANTGDQVFLAGRTKVLDAIENIDLAMTI